MILVDANVLIDVMGGPSAWQTWSEGAMTAAANADLLGINPIIYAEVSIGFDKPDRLDQALADSGIVRLPLPFEAGFLAGKAFLEYRRRGGARSSPLPDFYIAAHAAVIGATLLTRDPSRHRSYFPSVSVIAT